MFKKLTLAAFAIALSVSSAHAGPSLHSFDAENGGSGAINYTGFANYNVTQGSVDLIGNGFFDTYAGNGLYVDLAGSTGQFGALTTKTIFGAGTYHIGLSLGGPIYSGIADGANVSWGQGPGLDFTLAGLTTMDYSFDVTLLNAAAFTVSDLGLSGNANVGATLFGFQVARATAVPEPLTLSLFGAGVAGLAAIRRRKRSKPA